MLDASNQTALADLVRDFFSPDGQLSRIVDNQVMHIVLLAIWQSVKCRAPPRSWVQRAAARNGKTLYSCTSLYR